MLGASKLLISYWMMTIICKAVKVVVTYVWSPSLSAKPPLWGWSPLLLCNLHKRHQILIIVNIITINSAIKNSVFSFSSLWLNLMAGVDSTSSPPLCQRYDWWGWWWKLSKLVGCRHLKLSIMLLKFFFTSLELFVFQQRSGPTKQGDFHSSDL